MRVTEVIPPRGEWYDISTDEGRGWIESVYARSDPAYVRLNMITTPTGSAVGSDGTSETLSSRVDRRILGVIRAAADAVVVGAATVRAEGYLLPARSRLAVVTASGDLTGHRLGEGDSVLLVAPAGRAAEVRARAGLPRAEVVAVPGADDLEPAAIVAALAQRGLSRIVCEGGPRLAGRFAAAGVVDEYCVTVAPVLTPAQHPFLALAEGTAPSTHPTGMLVDEAAFSYLRLARS
jgi:riboflavin biosynthesis pyrimidine reductase